MSEADKIFEEIGYKKHEHNIFKEPPKEHEWITQDEPYIEYLDGKTINGTFYSMFIMFMMNTKKIQIGGYEKRNDTVWKILRKDAKSNFKHARNKSN